ncbi:MAG: hypothetical protein JNN15_17140 [Blastocatellia bacterium]|nr:hypothetical protein [Blastocatellia bacterium]
MVSRISPSVNEAFNPAVNNSVQSGQEGSLQGIRVKVATEQIDPIASNIYDGVGGPKLPQPKDCVPAGYPTSNNGGGATKPWQDVRNYPDKPATYNPKCDPKAYEPQQQPVKGEPMKPMQPPSEMKPPTMQPPAMKPSEPVKPSEPMEPKLGIGDLKDKQFSELLQIFGELLKLLQQLVEKFAGDKSGASAGNPSTSSGSSAASGSSTTDAATVAPKDAGKAEAAKPNEQLDPAQQNQNVIQDKELLQVLMVVLVEIASRLQQKGNMNSQLENSMMSRIQA